jgi:hypothetical protein
MEPRMALRSFLAAYLQTSSVTRAGRVREARA